MPIKPARELVQAANAEVESLTVDQARELVDDDNVVFIDVREPAEWQAGHVPGAVHAPRGLLEFKADPSLDAYHDKRIEADKRLVVYCASGGRSVLATKTLKDMGYDKVVNLAGGFTAWNQAGNDVERD